PRPSASRFPCATLCRSLFRNICGNCDLGLATLLRLARDALLGERDRMRRFFAERIKRITIKPFMDLDTMNGLMVIRLIRSAKKRSEEHTSELQSRFDLV